MNPIISDANLARPAGALIRRNGALYRPSQNCGPRYGYGLNLNEVSDISLTAYSERKVAAIEPTWDRSITGVHTFCHAGRLTMVDAMLARPRFW